MEGFFTAFGFLIFCYMVYFVLSVADYINAYPFNGGWPF